MPNSRLYPALLVLALAGCDPTRFTLSAVERDIDARIYSDHRLVSYSRNGFTMLPGGSVALTYPYATQYRATFRLTLEEGSGVNVLIHPIVEEQIVDSVYILTLDKNSYILREGNTVLAAKPIGLPLGKTEIFRIYSEEGYLELTLGCDTLYKGVALRKESDDIIFTAPGGSKVSVYGPHWHDIEMSIIRESSLTEKKQK